MDWITAEAASELTGTELSDRELNAAAVDVYDEMRWTPVLGLDLQLGTRENTRRVDALGRAIAWQAAYRKTVDQAALLEGRNLQSESFGGSYSRTYAAGGGTVKVVTPRARKLLAENGLIATSGTSSTGHASSRSDAPLLGSTGGDGYDDDTADGPFIPVDL